MKILLKIVVVTLLFWQCNTSKISFQKNPEFTVIEVYSQDWFGGQPGNSGTNLVIEVLNSENITPDSLYFQNRVSSVDIKPAEKGTLWVGRFQKVGRKEVILNESDNTDVSVTIPEMENFPFKLENNEAVLLYHQNNTAYYYKISEIKTKESIYFPSARPGL